MRSQYPVLIIRPVFSFHHMDLARTLSIAVLNY